jgi:electron transport complex protein RnfD
MKTQTPTAGPYTHEPVSITRTMGLVMLALVPGTAFGIYQFGWPALFLWLLTIVTALLAEAACLRVAGKPIRPYLMDGSALLTGWLLAMTLPPWAPWWIAVVGSLFAIVVAKQIFGGIGQNLFNPAMAARVALLISFPLEMTTWVMPKPFFSEGAPDFLTSLAITFGSGFNIDTMSSASVLGHVKTELTTGDLLSEAMHGVYDPMAQFIGMAAGSLGETSSLLILAGGIFLLTQRIISWHIPVTMLATLALLATVFNIIDPDHYPNALYHLLSGATMLAAFFIATDLVTSPVTARGQMLFGAGCGALVFVIRSWAGYPEGAGFAVLLMNALTPLIDHYIKPRIYGRTRKGEPIQYADNAEGGNG